MRGNRGSGLGTGIVVVFVLLAVGVAVAYFMNPLFKTKVDTEYDDFTGWPMEKIEKNKEEYLRWALKKVEAEIDVLSAQRLGVSQGAQTNLRNIEETEKQLESARKLSGEFKSAYKSVDASGSWPAKLKGAEYTEEELRAKVLEFHREIERLERALASGRAKQSDDKIGASEIEKQLATAKAVRDDIARQIEVVKRNESVENLGEIRSQVLAIADMGTVLSNEGAKPSSQQMIREDLSTPSESEFRAILNSDD